MKGLLELLAVYSRCAEWWHRGRPPCHESLVFWWRWSRNPLICILLLALIGTLVGRLSKEIRGFCSRRLHAFRWWPDPERGPVGGLCWGDPKLCVSGCCRLESRGNPDALLGHRLQTFWESRYHEPRFGLPAGWGHHLSSRTFLNRKVFNRQCQIHGIRIFIPTTLHITH